MIRTLRRVCSLTPAERLLALEATIALGAAAFAIAVFPFRRIAAAAARRVTDGDAGEEERARHVRRVRWAVTACARRMPWRAKCFEQGLAAQWMLGRRRIFSTLHYGIAKAPDRGLIAHVWLRSGALDVVGCENKDDFSELARFPALPCADGPR